MSGYAGQSPAEAKRTVRAGLRQQRRELVPARDRDADASWLAQAGLAAAHDAGAGPGDWVAAYEAMPTEPPTGALIDALSAHGIRVMVPVTLPDLDLDWRDVGTDEALGREAIGWAKVVFVPAHAVDLRGIRVGQGGGCYDRVIPRTNARLIALVHPFEVVLDGELPRDAHDQPVHAVLAAGEPLRELGRSMGHRQPMDPGR
jgi:5-formyltetrahydrofolate cyclo-ligase